MQNIDLACPWKDPPTFSIVKWYSYMIRSGKQISKVHKDVGRDIMKVWIEKEHITRRQYLTLNAVIQEAGGGSFLPICVSPRIVA